MLCQFKKLNNKKVFPVRETNTQETTTLLYDHFVVYVCEFSLASACPITMCVCEDGGWRGGDELQVAVIPNDVTQLATCGS